MNKNGDPWFYELFDAYGTEVTCDSKGTLCVLYDAGMINRGIGSYYVFEYTDETFEEDLAKAEAGIEKMDFPFQWECIYDMTYSELCYGRGNKKKIDAALQEEDRAVKDMVHKWNELVQLHNTNINKYHEELEKVSAQQAALNN